MQQQRPVKMFFNAEPFVCQTMTKLLNTIMSTTLVTGNSGMVTFWEAQHATMPTKRHAYHAAPSGRCSALTVTAPPMQHATPTTLCILVGTVP
jgi:hypothetical protein